MALPVDRRAYVNSAAGTPYVNRRADQEIQQRGRIVAFLPRAGLWGKQIMHLFFVRRIPYASAIFDSSFSWSHALACNGRGVAGF